MVTAHVVTLSPSAPMPLDAVLATADAHALLAVLVMTAAIAGGVFVQRVLVAPRGRGSALRVVERTGVSPARRAA